MPDCQRSSRVNLRQKPDFHPTIGREGETATFVVPAGIYARGDTNE